MMMQKVRVAIVGPTGYTAYEAIRILLRHPHVQITALASRRQPQPHIAEIFPALRGMLDLRCEEMDAHAIARKADVALLCLPHVVAMQSVPAFLEAGCKVIDLSADYRLKDPADYQQWYKHEHTDLRNLSEAVFGLPEFYREKIRSAKLIANPGCYPTASILGIAPFVSRGLVEPGDLVVSATSGVSGAGKEAKPEHHFPERNETFEAYGVGTHRHMIEIQRTLEDIAHQPLNLTFVPHLAPMHRGILATIFLKPRKSMTAEEALDVLAQAYRDEPFVRVGKDLPSTKNVALTNFCDITARMAGDRLIVLSAIDNLIKGASGQAIQNMNLQFDLPETAGLLC
jgi:N-acetyl-gamma-glutamyl-phosphate reductase